MSNHRRLKPENVEFESDYSKGQRLVITQFGDSVEKNRIVTLDVNDRWTATALFEAARKALLHHRATHVQAVKSIDETLAGR